MTRVKRGVATKKRHNKLKRMVKGYSKVATSRVKWAKNFIAKAGQNSYRGRKLKKRQMRSTWITRINAGCRAEGVSYSRLINGMLHAQIAVDRKILADLAVSHPEAFKAVVAKAKTAIK
ncbi:50S ribosomal protein L20 [Candidatus Peregrinibacteria bacterium]|nr:50S ribosomal protein L20 [Candidatus Peregrinibacteria bacterium]